MTALALRRYDGSRAELLNKLDNVRSLLQAHGGSGGYLLERLIVDKASGIFWNIQLPFLYVLAKLPGKARRVSVIVFGC